MGKATVVPITPSVLTWAIKESAYSPEEVAKKVGVSATELRAWERGEARPTLTRFRKLAATLKRTPATFLLPSEPTVPSTSVHFRHPPNAERQTLSPVERRYIREAIRLQEATGWLMNELGEEAWTFPEHTIKESAETVAESVRRKLQSRLPSSRRSWATPAQAFDAWRAALESLGVLVFLFPMGKTSGQGFSLWDGHAPLIAVNTYWAEAPRIFTLFHEFGHILTRTSSVCLERSGPKFVRSTDPTERWCERLAAAILLPWGEVTDLMRRRFQWTPGDLVDDLKIPSAIASSFRVSLRAATLRLIEHEAASWDLYKQIQPVSEFKRGGGGGGSGRDRKEIRLDQYGKPTIDLFLRALDKEVIGRTDVLDYLDLPDSGLSQLQGASPKGR